MNLFEDTRLVSSGQQQVDREEIPDVAPRGELAARNIWRCRADTNPSGNIFGGWIMASMDAAAGMTTTRLAEGQTVTVASPTWCLCNR